MFFDFLRRHAFYKRNPKITKQFRWFADEVFRFRQMIFLQTVLLSNANACRYAETVTKLNYILVSDYFVRGRFLIAYLRTLT